MPKTATKPSDQLEALAVAMGEKDAAFYAANTFSLYMRHSSSAEYEAQLLKQLKPLVSQEELASMKAFFKATKEAAHIMHTLQRTHMANCKKLADEVLDMHAKPSGKGGWYEFWDRSNCCWVRVQVQGFDSCYRTKEGSICGSVRVSKYGNGSTEPWRFFIDDEGRMNVHTRDLY